MPARFASFVLLSGCAAVLMGCTTTDDDKCPLASSLVDTASITELAQDQRPLFTAQIFKVSADCDIEKYDHTVSSSLDIEFTATRPSTGGPDGFDAPYFVAVTLGNRILSKHEYTAHFSFDPGATTASLSESRNSPTVHMEKGKQPYDYAVLVGFQLTHAQLQYNRTVGRYPK